MIREAIVKLVNKENLTYEMAEGAMDEIMGGKADPIQISAFLTAMTMKGETIEEITACANGMRKHGVHMEHDKDVLEIVGTGGDKSNSFNISTTASLVISAGGVAVAKHGNRAASSASGTADCLEALGVVLGEVAPHQPGHFAGARAIGDKIPRAGTHGVEYQLVVHAVAQGHYCQHRLGLQHPLDQGALADQLFAVQADEHQVAEGGVNQRQQLVACKRHGA